MVAPLIRETIGDNGITMGNELLEARIDGLEAGALSRTSPIGTTRAPRFDAGHIVTNLPMEPDWVVRFCNSS